MYSSDEEKPKVIEPRVKPVKALRAPKPLRNLHTDLHRRANRDAFKQQVNMMQY
jgi:hypothetical protein